MIFIYLFIFLSFSRIPSKGKLEVPMDLSEWGDSCGDAINYLEHVEVGVNLTYTLRGELLIKLISPQGTVSNLTHYRMSDSSFGAKDLNWVLMTLHHWGENAIGVWKLTLENYDLNHENTGKFNPWHIVEKITFKWQLLISTVLFRPLKLLFPSLKMGFPVLRGNFLWLFLFVCLFFFLYVERYVTLYFSVKGTLFNWTLILHGTTLNPLKYNHHVPSTVSPQTTENTVKSTPAHSPTGTFYIASFVVHFPRNKINYSGQNYIKEAPLSMILPHFYIWYLCYDAFSLRDLRNLKPFYVVGSFLMIKRVYYVSFRNICRSIKSLHLEMEQHNCKENDCLPKPNMYFNVSIQCSLKQGKVDRGRYSKGGVHSA